MASANDLPAPGKLAAARAMVKHRSPYYRAILHRARWQESDLVPTMGMTHAGLIYYSVDFVSNSTVEELAAAVVHELYHWLRDHHGRGKALGGHPLLWNMAGDLEINDDLPQQGYVLPASCLHPKQFDLPEGQLMEWYYAQLRQQAAESEGGGEGGDSKGSPAESTGQGPGRGRCGGVAGNPCEGEPGSGQAKDAEGESEAAEGITEAEAARIRKEVAQDIQQHAKERGKVPGGWLRWAGEQLEPPKINWRQRLSQIVRRATTYRPGAVVTHYLRPSRKQAGLGFGVGRPVMAAWRHPVPRVMIAVDTSGSMGQEEMGIALRELDGILKATGAEADFVSCDAAVHSNKAVRTWQEARDLLVGGGGTDFRPIFDLVTAPGARLRPEVMVIVTDGYGPAPEHGPHGVKVIWLLAGKMRTTPAGWGEVIEVEE